MVLLGAIIVIILSRRGISPTRTALRSIKRAPPYRSTGGVIVAHGTDRVTGARRAPARAAGASAPRRRV
jgi:hypothetical protein